MIQRFLNAARARLKDFILSVPVGWKVIGIGLLPVVILGLSLNYWVRLGLSDWLSYLLTDVRVDAAMAAGGRSVMLVTVLAAFLSIILSLFFTDVLTSPLLELKKTAEKVADGHYETRAKVWANDEIGSLALSINQMIDNFVKVQDDLRRTNRQLEIVNQIAFAAERDLEIHDILYIILKNVLDLVKLDTGWIYLYDPEVGKFHLASWHNIPEALKENLLQVSPQALCVCQQNVVERISGGEVFVHPCRRLEHCAQPGLMTQHITIPLEARDQHFGSINLLLSDDGDVPADSLEVLLSIGAQVSEIVANAWLQLKLAEKEEARQLLLESLVTAQENERARLARELHDHAGQSLTSLLVRLKVIERQSNEPHVQTGLNNLLDVVSDTIEQIRDLSYQLRPPALEGFGLNAALQSLVKQTAAQTDLQFECRCRFEGTLSSEIEVMLYRIAQEALTNILHHAQARHVSINLYQQLQQVHLEIEDDGCGFDPSQLSLHSEQRHLGLISMSERAELLGGKFQLYSSPGAGTRIEIRIPVPMEV